MNGDYERGDCHGQKGLTGPAEGCCGDLRIEEASSGQLAFAVLRIPRCQRNRSSFCKKDVSLSGGSRMGMEFVESIQYFMIVRF